MIHDAVVSPFPGSDTTYAVVGEDVRASGSAEPPPRTIGRYVVIREVGRGGFGVVYEAVDPSLDRRVAIKVVTPNRRGKAAARERLKVEARALAKLAHPNIVAVYDVVGDDSISFVMEYVEGQELQTLLATERDPVRIFEWFIAAGHGLAAAHGAGIVHRDFKPANVLITSAGAVKVADFGLATAVHSVEPASPGASDDAVPIDRLTRASELMGTPYYMAPEQHFGHALDGRADQYAWCLALARGLLGYDPLGVVGMSDVVRAKLRGISEHEDLDGVDERVWRVIERGLSTAPGDRYPSMDALLADLARARRRRRRVWGYAATGLIVAGLAVIGAPTNPQCEQVLAASPWSEQQREHWTTRDDVDPMWAAKFVVDMDAYAEQRGQAAKVVCDVGRDHEPWHADGAACLLALDTEVAAAHRDAALLPRDLGPYYEITQSLTPPGRCTDPATAADVLARLREFTGTRQGELLAQAYVRVGDLAAAREHADALLESSASPEIAWHILGMIAVAEGDFTAAHHSLEPAYFAALEQHDDARAGAAAALLLGAAVGLARDDLVADWTRHATAALERSGGLPRTAAALHEQLGVHAFWRGDYDRALEHQQAAVELWLQLYGPHHPSAEIARNNLAVTLERLGRWDESLAQHEELLATRLARNGPGHLDVYFSAANAANLRLRLGDVDTAIELGRVARVAAEESSGVHSVPAASAALALAEAELMAYGDTEIALPRIEGEGLEWQLLGLAMDLHRAQRRRGAALSADVEREASTAASAIRELLGEEHAITRDAAFAHASILAHAGDPSRAVATLRTIAGAPRRGEGGELEASLVEIELAAALVELGDTHAAIETSARAVERLQSTVPASVHTERAIDVLAAAQRAAAH